MMDFPDLYHYSSFPIELDREYAYEQEVTLRRPGKPSGLWVSVGRDWEKWCEHENYNIAALTYKHQVILHENARILVMNNTEEILEFSRKRCISSDSQIPEFKQFDSFKIDWQSVYRDFQGILIYPYLWECRLHCDTMWYYGWDCASGCIWDLSCIDKFVLIEEQEQNLCEFRSCEAIDAMD